MVDPEYYFAIKMIPWPELLKEFGLKMGVKKARVSRSIGIIKCCFHEEKHPSLVFYSDGGCHCFGCGITDDIFDFARRKLKGYDKAFKFFQKKFGVPPKFIEG